jgi:hypothetical protein
VTLCLSFQPLPTAWLSARAAANHQPLLKKSFDHDAAIVVVVVAGLASGGNGASFDEKRAMPLARALGCDQLVVWPGSKLATQAVNSIRQLSVHDFSEGRTPLGPIQTETAHILVILTVECPLGTEAGNRTVRTQARRVPFGPSALRLLAIALLRGLATAARQDP